MADHAALGPQPGAEPVPPKSFWPQGWWRLMEVRIGIVPVPVFVLLVILVAAFSRLGHVPGEISMALALMALGGFACAEIGKRIPLLKHIGAAAIFATFIPSALEYYDLLPKGVVEVVRNFHKTSNFLYLFITCIIVGSILSMDRNVLIRGYSGQGGTGDIAILTASNRMVLMPFAQVATRIGGAIVVTIALIVLSQIK
jgi:malate:Na+ symporter